MTQPRGRCPECGKDSALTSHGIIWRHGRWESGRYRDCGENARPMTAEQCSQWDEAERVRRQEAQAAALEREKLIRDRERQERMQWLAETRRAFRSFDQSALAECPWMSPLVTFIAVAADGPVTFACDVGFKCDLLRSAYEVLVAWPGTWSQHIFLLSDQDKRSVLAAMTS
jgi:hypothetical protein